MQKFSDPPVTSHEKCGGTVHRMLSAPALQFKGSGWYVNDYAKSGTSAPNNGSETKSDTPAATKSDSGNSSSTKESAPSSSTSTSDKSSS